MKATKFILLTCALISQITFGATYNISSSDSQVKWKGEKFSGDSHVGTVVVKEGSLDFENGALTGGTVTIDMNQITCEDVEDPKWNKKLIEHLKDGDFFKVDEFPTATLKVTNVEKKSEGEFEVTGDLTVKGKTNPVTFMANLNSEGESLTAEGTLSFDRLQFGIDYKSADQNALQKLAAEAKNKLIKNMVHLTLKVKAKK